MNQNYRVIKKEEIAELHGTGYILQHIKTKARVVVVSNQDDNKVFQIGFKTPPKDDTGVPHILEHSVLCGSREFPLKDPFVELVKGSLNTFLNAMTYPDKTVYPVASQNDKDFFNLVHVYLDAVFYPNIYQRPEIMKQEGWHYSLEEEDGEITYNGVVYNEMKGVFSSPDQQLARAIQKSLLPDTPYGFESGGDPVAIPSLTYENFLEFHKTYYHPSNSYIYLYGDMDVDEYLTFLDEHYLQDFDEKIVDTDWELQPKFTETKHVEEAYPVGENDEIENKTYLSYNMVVGTSLDEELYLAFQILERALFSAEGAPVEKALIDAKIGTNIESSYDNGILQPVFTVMAQDATKEQEDLFVTTIENTLKQVVEQGISKRSLQAAINYYEFKYKEGNFGRFPKGLMYGLQMYDSWLYDDESPFLHIKTDAIFETLKGKLETDYFENLVKTYILENTHKSVVVLYPEPGLQTKKDQQVKETLAKLKESLSKEEIRELVKQTKDLKAYQEKPSTKEELEKIPLLDIEDIRKDVKPLMNQEVSVAGAKVIWHPYTTNDVAYFKFAFDIKHLPTKLAPYASLLAEIYRSVDTKHYSYFELGNEISIKTGGIATGMDIYQIGDNDYAPYFTVKAKCLFEQVSDAFALIEEILFTSKLHDKKRLQEIIGEIYSSLRVEMTANGHKTAANRAMSYFSPVAKYKELVQGVDMYEQIKEWHENFDEMSDEIVEQLEQVRHLIFNQNKLFISYTGEGKTPESMEGELSHFVEMLSKEQVSDTIEPLVLTKDNEGFSTAAGVQYVATAGNFKKKGLAYTGALSVLQVIFSYEYLWVNVRVKGGAYGCMCSFNTQGDGMFVSYRDPKLAETYQVYEDAVSYVENFQIDDRDMKKYIIGAISNMDQPLEADALGARSFTAYIMGKTVEDLQKVRDQVLGCNQEVIRGLAPIVKAVVEDENRCTIGNEDKLKENLDYFKKIKSI